MNQLALDLSNTPAARMTPPGRKAAPPRSRRTDPETSQRAAFNVARFAAGHYGLILDALRSGGPGTFREIAERAGLERHAVARRLPELQQAGKVTRGAETRDGCSVWRIA